MSVDNDNNFTTFPSGLAVSIAYLERRWDAEYWRWLRRNTFDEWVSE
jgi:hypothetical protein